ncbi:9815_t:CDS:2, partial [Funneliformis mosseae]
NETPVQKLARKSGIVPSALPNVLQNNAIATNVLYAVKNMMKIDDPAIVVQWNDPGFNDVPAMPGCRNGVAGQTLNAIVAHFTANGGTDVLGQNTVFLFRTNIDLGFCEENLPLWVRRQNGIPDVCVSAFVIHKLTLGGQIDVAPFGYAFNR